MTSNKYISFDILAGTMGQTHSLPPKAKILQLQDTMLDPGCTAVLPKTKGCDSETREQAEGDWVVLEKCSCGEVSDKRKSHEMVQLKGVESGVGDSEPCESNIPPSLVPFEYNLTAVVEVPENSGIIDGRNELESENGTTMEEVAFKTARLCYTGVRAVSPLLPLVVAGVVGELERGLGMGSG